MTDSNPRIHFFDTPNPNGEPGTHRIAFYEWGDPASPPLFCVHGLTRNGRDFDYLARALAEDYRVISVDVPGRGKSGPLDKPEWYHNGTYMQDILALAQHLGLEHFEWVGTSMGGMIGMMIAALAPGKITRMVLNDIGAELTKDGLERIATYVGRICEFPDYATADKTFRQLLMHFGVRDEEHWAHLMEHSLVKQPDGKVRLAYDPRLGDGFRMLIEQAGGIKDLSLWMFWDAIKIPVLIVRGETSDILTRDCAAKMCEANPNASLIEFAGVGHAPTLMESQQIEPVKRWLKASS